MDTSYQVMVIGAGPAGYTAAIRAAQLGFKTACVEVREQLGGTCLNEGCIPSKALLDSSERYASLLAGQGQHGIITTGVALDLARMMQRKDGIVQQLTRGIDGLLKANAVDRIQARARVLANRQVECELADGEVRLYQPQNLIIASGSSPMPLSVAPWDGEYILDSTAALELDAVPERVGIIGAGAIGLELGSVWSRLGSKVVVLEALEDLLPMVDRHIAREAAKSFAAQGLDIRLGCLVLGAELFEGGNRRCVRISVQARDNQEETLEIDRLIVAIGREPNSALLTDESGIQLQERGAIVVDQHCVTSVPGVYAIGDVVRGPMLAHKGMEEGIMVAERLCGHQSEVNYQLVPAVVYTHPEIAWVGKSEQGLKSAGLATRSGIFPFSASGRAIASDEASGMVKVIADDDGQILAVHIIGPGAAELVQQAVIGMEFGAEVEDMAAMVFSHPTVSEALHEAVLAVEGRAIHIPSKSRGTA